ncbi:sigma-54 interaction domain-containing protein [Arenicella xantha]|uniref:Fis family sigma54 specific transcriptional regulator n=1 Tax=Arenicella xantha TaxID=644221 RepID=A0A395JJT6_9GAMM|nr:sigma-54 dependent transcriptional regulator [Arenicella xantha]RBP50675.1 Fis family sigma54 specific transcriptional regulator [Arenicella xantha]
MTKILRLVQIMQNHDNMGQMLEAYDVPAILVTADYEILASNTKYRESFGEIDWQTKPRCYAVSHGYNRPCDQAGEDCPLLAAKESKHKETVLHIHQTPNGREHVDVEMIPIFDEQDQLSFFVELLKPVPLASGSLGTQKMLGSSQAFERMLRSVTQVANSNASVLLLGESGTGKELVSQTIHMASKRSDQALVTLECSGLSETLIESELFGHKKGAFTGANSDKPGLVEKAHGGTLFLDEIGDVSLATQVKLLRLIESKTFRRVGGTEVRTADFRLICATHRDLANLIEQGLFRLDLYYRINVFPILIPSLDDRLSDIPQLVEHFLRLEDESLHITQSAIDVLQHHRYRGNIRELRNIIDRAVVLCETNIIDETVITECIDLDRSLHHAPSLTSKHALSLRDIEAEYLNDLMKQCRGDKQKVANIAKVSLRTLYRKLDRYAISEADT